MRESIKKFLNNFKDYLIICTPEYHHLAFPFSKKWDEKLNALMANHRFIIQLKSNNVVKLGNETIWVGAHPYISFTPYYDLEKFCNVRPSRLTLLRAHRKLLKDLKFAKRKRIG